MLLFKPYMKRRFHTFPKGIYVNVTNTAVIFHFQPPYPTLHTHPIQM